VRGDWGLGCLPFLGPEVFSQGASDVAGKWCECQCTAFEFYEIIAQII